MPTVTVRDTSLYYETAGSSEPALLFIHGMCGDAWNWKEQMNRLSPYYTCVAYDRRGHSRSDAGVESQSVRTHADDAAALIEALDLNRPIVVGASAGGVVAIELLRGHPNLVRGAVLMEPPVLGLDPKARETMLAELTPRLEQAMATGGPHAAVDAFFTVVCTNFWAQLDDAGRTRIQNNAPMLFATLENVEAEITAEDLAKIEHPVLVMTGTASHPGHQSINRAVMQHLPNATGTDIEGSGHVIYAEKPEEFAQAVREFAREVAASAAASSPAS